MTLTDVAKPVALSIASVERDTGLSKDTLRVWERRYGFPAPARDALGERLYPLEQVDKLRLLKRLLDLGHRPGKVVGLSLDDLKCLAQSSSNAAVRSLSPAADDDLHALIALLTTHRSEQLRNQLAQLLLRKGLARFVTELVVPLNELVGEAWTRGEMQIFEEHLYTEVIQGLLRNSVNSIRRDEARPRVLLTTLPQEPHGLGLLMAEAMLALEGCRCISLGVQTPLLDVALASKAQRVDIVALSFSAAVNPNQALADLNELRQRLASEIELWAGGGCQLLHRRPPTGVTVLRTLEEIAPAVQRWRQAHGSD